MSGVLGSTWEDAMHIYGSQDLVWTDTQLRLSHRGRTMATIEPDQTWPGMWRVRLPKRQPSDMVNLTRARDAAVSLALAVLNTEEAPVEAPPMRLFARPLSVALST